MNAQDFLHRFLSESIIKQPQTFSFDVAICTHLVLWSNKFPKTGTEHAGMWLLWGLEAAGRFYLNTEAGQVEK